MTRGSSGIDRGSTLGRIWRRMGWMMFFAYAIAFLIPRPGHAAQSATAKNSKRATDDPARSELITRAKQAEEARNSGDPAKVAAANQLLLATGLREMAALRSLEGALPQAIALYQSSLSFEDSADTRIGLAVAQSKAGDYDEAIRQAREVLAKQPNDLRATRVLATSLLQKGDATAAIEPFEQIASTEPSPENTYALANCLLQTRRPSDRTRAEAMFQEMEQQNSNSGSLHVLIGRSYRDAGDLPAAVRQFQQALALDPKTPHAHYFLGLAELALNEWRPTPQAEAEIMKEVALYPRDYLANYMTGFLLSGDRRYADAEPYLKTAAVINPSAPEPPLYLGLNAYAQNDGKTAEPYLRRAVELTGTDEARSNYQIRRAYVDLGRILANSGRDQEAETFLAKARDLQVKVMQATQQSVASMAAAEGTSNSAAVIDLKSTQSGMAARSVDPTAALSQASEKESFTAKQSAEFDEQEKLLRAVLGLAYNDLATSEALRSNFHQAFIDYQQAALWDNSLVGLQKNLGLSAYRDGNFKDAAAALNRALQEQPGSAPVRAMLGISYFNMDEYAKAVEVFSSLGESGMRDEQAGYAWAASLAHVGDLSKATEVLNQYSSIPRNDSAELLIGQLWTAIGDYPRAIKTFSDLIEAEPTLPHAHFYAGLAYIHWEHWNEAAKEFQAELALSPEDADAKYHLGFVYKQQARLNEAVGTFQEVVAEHPNYANAQYELGKILLDRGQIDDAVTHLEAAARLEPQVDFTHYQLQAAYRKANRISDADRELEIYKRLKAEARGRTAQGTTVDR